MRHMRRVWIQGVPMDKMKRSLCALLSALLLAAATAVSAAIAQGKSADELALLAALFTVIGDDLALLALSVPGNTETPDGTD